VLPKAKGLEQISAEKTAQGMQVSSNNPMVGLEGRASLLVNLSHALKSNPTFFGAEGRPGNMIGKDTCVSFSRCPSPGPSTPVLPRLTLSWRRYYRFPRIGVHRGRIKSSRTSCSPLAYPRLRPCVDLAYGSYFAWWCPAGRCLAVRSTKSPCGGCSGRGR
jgi:hypothetical protein